MHERPSLLLQNLFRNVREIIFSNLPDSALRAASWHHALAIHRGGGWIRSPALYPIELQALQLRKYYPKPKKVLLFLSLKGIGAINQKCLLANALPEPPFKYRSNCTALLFS